MDYTVVVICLAALALWIIYEEFIKSSSREVRDFTRPFTQVDESGGGNPLQNPNRKPSLTALYWNLGDERSKLVDFILDELGKFGTPDLFWRGKTNGWVLSIKEDEGRSGSFVLTKETVIGQTRLLVRENDFNLDGWHYQFVELPITSEKEALEFINILKQKLLIF